MLFETKTDLMAEVGRWLAECQAIVDAGKYNQGEKLEVDPGGKRYLRIFYRYQECGYEGRRVFGFIDTTNGDVLKADGWKRPAEKARGNLFDESGGLGRVTAGGVR
jgi:hypothetical protein